MRRDDLYYTWKKGQDFLLSQFFSTKEFDCKCSRPECVEQKVSAELIDRLTWFRAATKSAIEINSGFRCEEHQAALRKAKVNTVVARTSQHTEGKGADVWIKSLTIDQALPIAEEKFDSIGVGRNFLHVDLRVGKRRWKY